MSDTSSSEKRRLQRIHVREAFHLVPRKYEPFFPAPQFVSCHLPFSFPSTNLLLDSAAVGERRSKYLPRCEREAQVAFSWPRAQRRGLVFPAVSDCSRPAECKHAVMCGAALETVDTARAIPAHEV